MTNTFQSVDPDELSELLLQAGDSFGIDLANADYSGVSTFGDLMQLIESKLEGQNSDGCTYQQAFYRLRVAFRAMDVDGEISPGTALGSVIPRKGRRRFIRQFDWVLGFESGLKTISGYSIFSVLCLVISPFLLFFSWNHLFVGAGAAVCLYLAGRFTTPRLDYRTIGDLARNMTWEQYNLVRKQTGTVNYSEIRKLFADWFSSRFAIDKSSITNETSVWG